MSLIENLIASSEIKSIVTVVSQEDQVVEVPHIDFIFRDRQWKLDDCTRIWQILRLQSLMGRAHIRAQCRYRKKWQFRSTSRRKNKLCQTSKSCQENEVHEKNQKFVQLIFDPGRHFQNLWSNSLPFYQAVNSPQAGIDAGQTIGRPTHWPQSIGPRGYSFI